MGLHTLRRENLAQIWGRGGGYIVKIPLIYGNGFIKIMSQVWINLDIAT